MKEAEKIWLCIREQLFLAKGFVFWEFRLAFSTVILENA